MSLANLLYDVDPSEIETFMNMVLRYEMTVSSVFNDWKGIDCKLAVKILHLTCEWKSDRIRLPGRATYISMNGKRKPSLNSSDSIIISYYRALWLHYASHFDERIPYILTVDKTLQTK